MLNHVFNRRTAHHFHNGGASAESDEACQSKCLHGLVGLGIGVLGLDTEVVARGRHIGYLNRNVLSDVLILAKL